MKTSLFLTLLAFITILGTGLRLHDLAQPSLWADEMFTIRDALGSAPPGYRSTRIGLQIAGVDVDAIQPEAYDTFRSHGMNEWNMRIGSATMGSLAIPLLGLVTAGFLGRRTALILALLLSLSTWHLLWSQHARFYAPMFLFFSAALSLYYSGAVDDHASRSRAKLAIAMLFAVAAVMTKPTANLLLAIIGLDLAIEWARTRKLPLSPGSLAIVVAGGLICVGLTATNVIETAQQTSHFLDRPQGVSPLRLVAGNVYLVGFPIVIMAGASVLVLWRARFRLVVFLASTVVIPIVAFAILSTLSHVELRYTFLTEFGWLALASLGLNWIWENTKPRLGWVAASVPLALIVGSLAKDALAYYESGYGHRPRWRHAFDYVERHRLPGEKVISREMWAGQFYLQDPTIESVAIDFCVPGSGRCVNPDPHYTAWDQLKENTWFVVKGTRFEIDEGKPHWLDGKATLMTVYPNRIPFPQETVRIYYFQADDGSRNAERS